MVRLPLPLRKKFNYHSKSSGCNGFDNRIPLIIRGLFFFTTVPMAYRRLSCHFVRLLPRTSCGVVEKKTTTYCCDITYSTTDSALGGVTLRRIVSSSHPPILLWRNRRHAIIVDGLLLIVNIVDAFFEHLPMAIALRKLFGHLLSSATIVSASGIPK